MEEIIDRKEPVEVGRILCRNLLDRPYQLYNGEGLHYAEACTAMGALRFAALVGEEEILARLLVRYEPLCREETGLVSRRAHVDLRVVGIIPLTIFRLTGDRRHLALGLSLADAQWEQVGADGLTPETRWWIDDVYMVGMLQMAAYLATGERKYADRAARQTVAYLAALRGENGLFFHGPAHRFHWGRGNGWMAAALAEVLAGLPGEHPYRAEISAAYLAMMKVLRGFQDQEGMWRQLVDKEEAWPESSATAMFAYAMSVGYRRGWLEAGVYLPVVGKAWEALLARLDQKGNLDDVCVGTGQGEEAAHYLTRPRVKGDLHGQAPLLWLAGELVAAGGLPRGG